VVGRVRRGIAAALLGLLVAGCASFPDQGPRDWRPKLEGQGELGGPPVIPDAGSPPAPPGGAPQSGAPQEPSGCVDPDPQVVATCLEPVGAIAVLPDATSALVGERSTGRVLRVARGEPPELVATLPVDATGGGGLTGLVLSPAFAEDRLVYAYTTTAQDNRVMRIAPGGEPPEPVFTGIPRGASHNGGALGVDPGGALLVATGDAGEPAAAGGPSLAGKVLRIDTLGNPASGNPDPASPVLSSGLRDPGGVCTDGATTWVTDRAGGRDVLHRLTPGALPAPAWTWPEQPGVAGCMAQPGLVVVAETSGAAVFALRPTAEGTFTGEPETLLADTYGRFSAAALAPDGLLWLGTVNKAPGGDPVSSDDRVIRVQPPSGGGQSRA
jgi:glucose/arabinose dehydrogenase